MAAELDTEGRYLFLNALANQLRYPNSHTHYFSCVLLYLFAEAKQVRKLEAAGLAYAPNCHVCLLLVTFAAYLAGDHSGADYKGAFRTLDRQSTAPVGTSHHIH